MSHSFHPVIHAGAWITMGDVLHTTVLDNIRLIWYNNNHKGGGVMFAVKVMYNNNIVMSGCAGRAVFG